MKRPSILNCHAHSLVELTDEMRFPGDRQMTRRALIFAAGVANNRKLLKELGSQESSSWYEGRRAADPNFDNPYWPNR
jgi:hypothetical protein